MNLPPTDAEQVHAGDLLGFIDQSPTPWHVVDTATQRLEAGQFLPLAEADRWTLRPGQGYFAIRGGASLVAFRLGTHPPSESGFRILGAHTDSPGLRLKPLGSSKERELLRVGVEVYGSPLLASYADRDLLLAGRVSYSTPDDLIQTRLVRLDSLRIRLPNLPIHLNRGVNEEGLKFNKQTELPLILGQSIGETPAEQAIQTILSEALEIESDALRGFELMVAGAQPGCFWGLHQEFLSTGRMDNQSSCHAALLALLATPVTAATQVIALFDHEEIGSESAQGAGSVFLAQVLARLAGGSIEDQARALARSQMVSADAAHAFHPNFPQVFEPSHLIQVNQGPAIKINVNQRYATEGPQAARFQSLAAQLGIKIQTYVHRSDLGCGSTIGPISAARLGIPVLDCGVPMWAMHSIRESAGVRDQWALSTLLTGFLAEEGALT